eukprot:4345328-Amphidinium_carterae.1
MPVRCNRSSDGIYDDSFGTAAGAPWSSSKPDLVMVCFGVLLWKVSCDLSFSLVSKKRHNSISVQTFGSGFGCCEDVRRL